jgi:hypothetical protein
MIQTSFSPGLIVILTIRVNPEIGNDTGNKPMNFTQLMALSKFPRTYRYPASADIHTQVPPQTEQQTAESSGILTQTCNSSASSLTTKHVWKAA